MFVRRDYEPFLQGKERLVFICVSIYRPLLNFSHHISTKHLGGHILTDLNTILTKISNDMFPKREELAYNFLPRSYEFEGVCYGFSSLYLNAYFCDEETWFLKRLAVMVVAFEEGINLTELTQSVKDKISTYSAYVPTEKEMLILEIPFFLETLAILQEPERVDVSRCQTPEYFLKTYPLIAPVTLIEEDKSPQLIYQAFCAPTNEELAAYLDEVKRLLCDEEQKIGMLITSSDHAVQLAYNKEEDIWCYLDINALHDRELKPKKLNSHELSLALYQSLESYRDKKSPTSLFKISFIGLDRSPRLEADLKVLEPMLLTRESAIRTDGLGNTLLSFALESGNERQARILIGLGANINHQKREPINSILESALISRNKAMLALLFEHGVRIHSPSILLMQAINTECLEIVELVSSYLGEIPALPDDAKISYLSLAVLLGCTDIVERLISQRENVNHRSPTGVTALHSAIATGHIETTQILLMHGADPNLATTEKGYCAIHIASGDAPTNQIQLIGLLISHGVNVNEPAKDGITPLMIAAATNNLTLVKYLVERGALVNFTNERGMTVLHFACLAANHEMVEFLLAQDGIDVNHKAANNVTPLHVAALKDNIDTVKLLLNAGANCLVKDSENKYPYQVAESKGHTAIIHLLKTHHLQAKVRLSLTETLTRLDLLFPSVMDVETRVRRILNDYIRPSRSMFFLHSLRPSIRRAQTLHTRLEGLTKEEQLSAIKDEISAYCLNWGVNENDAYLKRLIASQFYLENSIDREHELTVEEMPFAYAA